MKALLPALLVCTLSAPLDAATVVVIKDSPGGRVVDFDAQAMRWAAQKVVLVLDGRCASSCTRYTFPKWHLDVCATPRASLQFHKPWIMDRKNHDEAVTTPAAQREMDEVWKTDWLAQWSPQQQAFFRGKHVPSTSRGETGLLIARGKQLARFAKPCPAALIKLTRTGRAVIVNDNG